MVAVAPEGRVHSLRLELESSSALPSSAVIAERLGLNPEVFEAILTIAKAHPDGTPTPAMTREMGAVVETFRRLRAHKIGEWEEPKPQSSESVQRMGRYEVHSRLGEGGMGVVYRAWDPSLERIVALKTTHGRPDPIARQRFLREARAAASLHHPGIIAIYDVDEVDGQPFLAMDLLPGPTLYEAFPSMTIRERVGALKDVARAVGFAHVHGVLHRDLKPVNILLDAGRQPVVTDFGLAKQIGDMTKLTVEGAIMGTPAYMSPEQFRGSSEIGPPGDVFSLGVILYEFLTLVLPFQGESLPQLAEQLLTCEPRRPRNIDAAIPQDLENICLKALEKEPGGRYPSASELADDLQRWLSDEPVYARPIGLPLRLWRKVKRQRVPIGAACLVVASLLVLIPLWLREWKARERTRRVHDLWTRIGPLMSDAELYSRQGEVSGARERLLEAIQNCQQHLRSQETPDARFFLGRLYRRLGKSSEALAQLDRALAIKPDMGEASFERGLLKVEQYVSRVRQSRLRIPRVEVAQIELEESDLKRLREAAIRDLQAKVSQSAYYREVDAAYGAAELARMRLLLDDAEKGYHEVLKREPMYVEAWGSLAELSLIDRRDTESTLNHATKAIEIHRSFPRAHLVRCMAQMESLYGASPLQAEEKLRQALGDAERVLELEGANEEATRFIADIHVQRGLLEAGRGGDPLPHFNQALEIYTQILHCHPDYAEAYNQRGILYYERAKIQAAQGKDADEDYGGAIGEFTAAIQRYPRYIRAIVNRGVAWRGQGDVRAARNLDPVECFTHAIEDYDLALKIFPACWGAVFNRGIARECLGEAIARRGEDPRPAFTLAIEDYDAAAREDPDRPEPFCNRGNARELLAKAEAARGGNPGPLRDQAKADFNLALEKNPNLVEGHLGLGNLSWELGDLIAARQHWTRAVQLRPSLGSFLNPKIGQCPAPHPEDY